ncbi:MAG: CaiB/BaiF CoA transferase family protein [Minwuia sp.]|uniref:CaiB/BaiF CoA transferase family protein n=1 Tax=Minwuia sp. TaxID=2493630 RepID=UPI003A85BCDA
MAPRPLDGVRVIDLTNLLMAPYTSQILGDMGADVIKVEAPEGDPVRGIGPMRNPGMGHIFLSVNRSKRSIVLDLKNADGLAAMKALLKDAEVLIYNRRPHVMARLGLGYETVSEINPRIVYAGLFGYGQDGPYAAKPAFDDLIQGAVGIPRMQAEIYGQDPTYVPAAIVDRGVGLWAVGQINAALYHQARTGEGQRIDMPMFEMMASFVLGDHMGGAAFDPPLGPAGYKRMHAPDRRPYATSDGHVCVLIYTDRQWRSFFRAIGREADYDADPRFATITARNDNIAAIYADLAAILKTRTTADWLSLLDEADVPVMPMNGLQDLLDDPHLNGTGFYRTVEHPTEGRIRDMAVPSQWSRTQPEPVRPAPRLGEHSAEILREAGFDDSRIEAMMASGATA